jgi:hypothetical protein
MHLKLGNDFCKWHSWDLQESVCGCVELPAARSAGRRRVDGQIIDAKVLQKLKLVVRKRYKTCTHRLAQLAVVEHTLDLRRSQGNRCPEVSAMNSGLISSQFIDIFRSCEGNPERGWTHASLRAVATKNYFP